MALAYFTASLQAVYRMRGCSDHVSVERWVDNPRCSRNPIVITSVCECVRVVSVIPAPCRSQGRAGGFLVADHELAGRARLMVPITPSRGWANIKLFFPNRESSTWNKGDVESGYFGDM